MKICKKCGEQMPDTLKFCGECGGILEMPEPEKRICGECNAEIPDKMKFCGECGTAYSKTETAPVPVAEPEPEPPKADNAVYADTYDIFISYRRSGGETMAILLRDRLIAKGYNVFLDIENLNSGSFNNKLFNVIDNCKDFLLICSENSLDRCNNEGDWVRNEIAHAIKKGKNIIPLMLRGFAFPDTLPAEIDAIRMQNGVNANSHEYFDAAIDRLAEKFLISKPTENIQPNASESAVQPVASAPPVATAAQQTKKCPSCGFELPIVMKFCGQCGFVYGAAVQPAAQPMQVVVNNSSTAASMGGMYMPHDKSTGTAFWLCVFLGHWGVHRFYVGKAGTGILWFLTGGMLGIGSFIDMFMIAYGTFTDSFGRRLKKSLALQILVWIGLILRLAISAGLSFLVFSILDSI